MDNGRSLLSEAAHSRDMGTVRLITHTQITSHSQRVATDRARPPALHIPGPRTLCRRPALADLMVALCCSGPGMLIAG
jgi:hypothetical protein